ncbi:hypothetical protein AB0E01_44010, partial [Nocardia vinacea]
IIAGAAALLSTGGDAHALTGDVTLFGYHATDTAGLVVIWGITVGVIGLVELSLLLADTRRTHLACQIPGRSGNKSSPTGSRRGEKRPPTLTLATGRHPTCRLRLPDVVLPPTYSLKPGS